MTKLIQIILSLTLMFGLVACSSTIKGTDELIERAREELPISNADTTELKYAGLCGKEDKALIWFISGNEYQSHYYLPIEFNVVGNDEYTFGHTYKPMDRGNDIAVVQWDGGYSFIINNPNCASVKITDSSGTHEVIIEKDVYPYVFYHNFIPSEYVFLDEDGNEIK